MPFKFSIIFSGICAFVPDPDGSFDDPDHKITSVSVVLPNLFRSKFSEAGARREPHIPTLEVQSTQGWQGRAPELVAPDLAIGSPADRKREIHFLRGQRISFRVGGRNLSPACIEVLNFKTPPPADQTGPNPDNPQEKNFFWWVPKMEKVVPGSERIQGDLLQPSADEEASTTAVVELSRGQLSVPDDGLSARVMEFKKIQGAQVALRQQIAARIALDIEDAESVEIVFQNVGGEQTLKLEGARGDVVIKIQHLEVDSLFGTRPPRLPTMPEIDFETYYELSSSNVPRFIPHEVPAPPAADVKNAQDEPMNTLGLSLGGVCPPTAFSGKTSKVVSVPQASLESAPAKARTVRAPEKKAAKRVRRNH